MDLPFLTASSWSLVTDTEPFPVAATLFGAGTTSIHIRLVNSNFLKSCLCSNKSIIGFAPNVAAPKKFRPL